MRRNFERDRTEHEATCTPRRRLAGASLARRVVATLTWLAIVGCGEGRTSGGDQGSDVETGLDEPWPDLPGEPGPALCAGKELELIDLEWAVEVLDGSGPYPSAISRMEVRGDSLYVKGTHGLDAGFLERRTLDGELLWRVESDDLAEYPIAVDDTHVYHTEKNEDYATRIHRRFVGDGSLDEAWSAPSPQASGIGVLDAAGEHLMVAGYSNVGPYAPSDARFGLVSKIDTDTVLDEWTRGELDPDVGDGGGPLLALNGGGWLGAVRNTRLPHARLYSFGPTANPVDATYPIDVIGMISSIHERPDGFRLIMTSTQTYAGGSLFMVGTDLQGQELWREPIAPCGLELATRTIDRAVVHDGSAWVLVQTADDEPFVGPPLLARVSLDGELEGVWRVELSVEGHSEWFLSSLASSDDALFVEVWSHGLEGEGLHYYIARVR